MQVEQITASVPSKTGMGKTSKQHGGEFHSFLDLSGDVAAPQALPGCPEDFPQWGTGGLSSGPDGETNRGARSGEVNGGKPSGKRGKEEKTASGGDSLNVVMISQLAASIFQPVSFRTDSGRVARDAAGTANPLPEAAGKPEAVSEQSSIAALPPQNNAESGKTAQDAVRPEPQVPDFGEEAAGRKAAQESAGIPQDILTAGNIRTADHPSITEDTVSPDIPFQMSSAVPSAPKESSAGIKQVPAADPPEARKSEAFPSVRTDGVLQSEIVLGTAETRNDSGGGKGPEVSKGNHAELTSAAVKQDIPKAPADAAAKTTESGGTQKKNGGERKAVSGKPPDAAAAVAAPQPAGGTFGTQFAQKVKESAKEQPAGVVGQTAEAVTRAVKSRQKELRVHLSPEDLGGITIRIVSKNGELSAQITADSRQTGHLLAGGMEDLNKTMQQNGITMKSEILFTGGNLGYGSRSDSGGNQGYEQYQGAPQWVPAAADGGDTAVPDTGRAEVSADGSISFLA